MLTQIFSPSLGHSFDQESIAVVKSEAKGTELYMEHSGCLGLSTSNTDSSLPRLAHGSVNISVQGSFPSCQSQDSLFPAYPILTQGHFSPPPLCHHSRLSQQLPNGVLTSALRAVHTSGPWLLLIRGKSLLLCESEQVTLLKTSKSSLQGYQREEAFLKLQTPGQVTRQCTPQPPFFPCSPDALIVSDFLKKENI